MPIVIALVIVIFGFVHADIMINVMLLFVVARVFLNGDPLLAVPFHHTYTRFGTRSGRKLLSPGVNVRRPRDPPRVRFVQTN
jgi:hypothetical protein